MDHSNGGVLTAARAGETLGATRSEIKSSSEFARIAGLAIDLVLGETWVVPAERMKEGKEHYVPLPRSTLKLIAGRSGDLFPGHKGPNVGFYSTRFALVTLCMAFDRVLRIGIGCSTRKSFAKWRIPLAMRWSKRIGEVRASIADAK